MLCVSVLPARRFHFKPPRYLGVGLHTPRGYVGGRVKFKAYVNLLAVRFRLLLAQRSVVGSSAHLCVHRSVAADLFLGQNRPGFLLVRVKLVPTRF